MSTSVTLRGRLTRDPELRYSQAGKAVVKFAVVTSRRVKDKDSGEWSDTDTTFWDCVSFGQMAENVAESLAKGTAVIVQGNASTEEWEAKDGSKRRSLKVMVDDVAPSLRWASVKVNGSSRSDAGQERSRPASDDPWSSDKSGSPDEPPF